MIRTYGPVAPDSSFRESRFDSATLAPLRPAQGNVRNSGNKFWDCLSKFLIFVLDEIA